MSSTVPAGWPGDDAARDGAPLDVGIGRTDPRVLAAERIIRQLRTLVAALTAQADGEVLLSPRDLSDPRLRGLEIVVGRDGVQLRLPPPIPDETDETAGSGEGSDASDDPSSDSGAAGGADVGDVRRAGDSALMRRLAKVASEHAARPDTAPGTRPETPPETRPDDSAHPPPGPEGPESQGPGAGV